MYCPRTVPANYPVNVHRPNRMDAGQIVEEGTPHDFFTNPQNERAQQFLNQILKH
jgi:ABC-type polar amino acid transport system ATPase subunit